MTRGSRLPVFIGAGLAALILVVAGTVFITLAVTRVPAAVAAAPWTPLKKAKLTCAPTSTGATLTDDDRTLVIDTVGESDPTGITYVQLECLLGRLDIPDGALAHVRATRGMDGGQTDAWGGVTALWTFHPARGVTMLLEMKD